MLLLLLGVAGGVLIWLTYPKPGVTRANYMRIREGMTLREVEALLGGPATGEGPLHCADGLILDYPGWYQKWWEGADLSILINYDDDRRVLRKCHDREGRDESTFLGRLRHLLPW
jgi:hypothetical protein